MGSTPFNTGTFNIVQLLGNDGATPVAPDNPLSFLSNATATLGTVVLGTGTANPIGTVLLGTGTANPIGTVVLGTGTANPIGIVRAEGLSATARGTAIAAGGTSQQIMASNANRKGFVIQNPSTAGEQGISVAESLYINLANAATTGTSANLAVLPPGASFAMGLNAGLVSTEQINAIAVTTNHIIYAKEF